MVLIEARKTGDFSKVPKEINPEFHRILTNEAMEQYAVLFTELLDSTNRPLVMHCSHGIHRTGTAAAIILWTLGVPWETIQEDYLLSNEFRQDQINMRLGQLRTLAAENQGIRENEVDMENVEAFYVLQDFYIDAARDEIIENYGSIENYIDEGLGISKSEIEKLKSELLF